MNLLICHGWLHCKNKKNFGKSLFEPEYCIMKKAFDDKLPLDKITRLFANQDKVMKLNISAILIVEEIAKGITDKSDIECKFYESAEDVPDPRDLSSDKRI